MVGERAGGVSIHSKLFSASALLILAAMLSLEERHGEHAKKGAVVWTQLPSTDGGVELGWLSSLTASPPRSGTPFELAAARHTD